MLTNTIIFCETYTYLPIPVNPSLPASNIFVLGAVFRFRIKYCDANKIDEDRESPVHTKVFLCTFFLFHRVLQPIFKPWPAEYFGF